MNKENSVDLTGIIIVCAVITIGFIIFQGIYVFNKKEAMEKELKSLSEFISTQKIMGDNGETGIAIDEVRQKIVLINNKWRITNSCG
jgi:hypothetical protein